MRLDLVFMETTRLYLEGAGGQTAKSRSADQSQKRDFLSALAVNDESPGKWVRSIADVKEFSPYASRLGSFGDASPLEMAAVENM